MLVIVTGKHAYKKRGNYRGEDTVFRKYCLVIYKRNARINGNVSCLTYYLTVRRDLTIPISTRFEGDSHVTYVSPHMKHQTRS